jgi:hypothetical protein
MAQTLARWSSKNVDLDGAIFWAEQAVEMSVDNKTNNGFAHQIFAVVLDEKFIYQTNNVNSVTPRDVVGYISLIMEAIDHFIEASRLRKGHRRSFTIPYYGLSKFYFKMLKIYKRESNFDC